MQLHQLLQTVVAVDDAAIQIVEIRGCEAAAIERNQRTQLRWNHRKHVENHPLGLVAGFAERLDDAKTLGILQLLLLRCLGLHLLAHLDRERFDVDLAKKFLDALRAHHGDELAGCGRILVERALALVADHLTDAEPGVVGRFQNDVCFEIQNALELTKRDIEQVADAARQTLEKPDMRARARQFDVAQPLTANARQRDFDAALIANNAAVLHALVLAAQALPVGDRTENPGAEQAIALRLEGPVIDGFRLCYFTV